MILVFVYDLSIFCEFIFNQASISAFTIQNYKGAYKLKGEFFLWSIHED